MTEKTFSLRQLQEEQKPWVAHNFGDRPSWMPLMGICEEMGELMEAGAVRFDVDMFIDSIADAVIFMSDYCSGMDFDLQELWEARCPSPKLLSHSTRDRAWIFVGRAQHHHLKLHQGIRGDEFKHRTAIESALSKMLYELEMLALDCDRKLLDVVEQTWNEVKKRDWKADPHKEH